MLATRHSVGMQVTNALGAWVTNAIYILYTTAYSWNYRGLSFFCITPCIRSFFFFSSISFNMQQQLTLPPCISSPPAPVCYTGAVKRLGGVWKYERDCAGFVAAKMNHNGTEIVVAKSVAISANSSFKLRC